MVQQTLVWLAAAALLASCTMAEQQALSRKMLQLGLGNTISTTANTGLSGIDSAVPPIELGDTISTTGDTISTTANTGLSGIDSAVPPIELGDTVSTTANTGLSAIDSAVPPIGVPSTGVSLTNFLALCDAVAASPSGILPPVPAITDASAPYSEIPEYQISDEDQEFATDLYQRFGEIRINVTPALVDQLCNATTTSPPPPATLAAANPFYTYTAPPNPYLSELSEYQLSDEDRNQLIAQLIRARFGNLDQVQVNVTPPQGRKL